MSLSNIPNLISIFRILLAIPVVFYLQQHQYTLAFAIFLIACVSDLVDGYVARRYQWVSQLGGWLDPVGDKILLNSVYLALWSMGVIIPGWLLLCIIFRDIMIVGGVFYYYYRIEKITAHPTFVSKVNTLMQLVLVLLILFHKSFPELAPLAAIKVIDSAMLLVVGLTLVSGAWYVVIGMRRMRRAVFVRTGS
ncbi:hypothetical protein MNBD_GAMMA12-995 [hydrothermal vent metagenome]|uniref:CDP-diacylglycerol--glycerol-3-phosphate 3-phosphatidyltransferase n=1 Tax=hydrothermal vent metagenome TaxID=652676 RepID=A0A3B0YNH7_9ZZZZ